MSYITDMCFALLFKINLIKNTRIRTEKKKTEASHFTIKLYSYYTTHDPGIRVYTYTLLLMAYVHYC